MSNRSLLEESLNSLCANPESYREVSTTWQSVVISTPVELLTGRQWRWLSQISGMMGLFRATNVIRLQSARRTLAATVLPESLNHTLDRGSALIQLGLIEEALSTLNSEMGDLIAPNIRDLHIQRRFVTLLLGQTSQGSSPEINDGFLATLRGIVGGKRVGIIGNSQDLVNVAADADIEVLVRLNAFKLLDRDAQLDCANVPVVIYLNSTQSVRLANELGSKSPASAALVSRASLIAVRSKHPGLVGRTIFRSTARPPIHDHGPVIGSRAVFDCLLAGAEKVKLFGFDFNQSSLIGELPWEMCRKLGDQGMLNQFEFMHRLWSTGLLEADPVGTTVLELGADRYAALLEDRYGDWSVRA